MKLDDVLDQLKESNSDHWSNISSQKRMSFNDNVHISIVNDVRAVQLGEDQLPAFISAIVHRIEPGLDLRDLDAFSAAAQFSVLYYNDLPVKEFKVFKLGIKGSNFYIPEPKSVRPVQFRNKWLIRILNSNRQLKTLFETFESLEIGNE